MALFVQAGDSVAAILRLPRDPDAMRYMLTDELWAVMGPLVEQTKRHSEFGEWDAVYNRLRRWVYSGSLKALFELLTADLELGEVRRELIDSTIVRAHSHAAGARRKKNRSGRPGRRRTRLSAAAAAV